MAKTNQKVAKSTNPEQAALIANIQALLNELETMDGAAEPDGDEAAMPAMKADREETVKPDYTNAVKADAEQENEAGETGNEGDDPRTKLMKSIVASTSDGIDANDKAEDRVEAKPDQDQENLAAIGKALSAMVKSRRPVTKSNDGDSLMVDALNQVAKAMTSIVARQAKTEAILFETLDGMGVLKSLEAKPVQKSRPRAQYDDCDTQNVMKALASLINNKGEQQEVEQGEAPRVGVRKSLSEFTGAFGQMSKNLWGQ